MNKKQNRPQTNYSAELWKALKHQTKAKAGIVTDAEMNRIIKDGKTADGKVLLLSQRLDEKNIKFRDFFTP